MALGRIGALGLAGAAVAGLALAFAGTFISGDPASKTGTITVIPVATGYTATSASPPAALTANTDYYVDCGALSNGTGASFSSPWNSLSSVNGKSGGFSAGDRILFKRDTICSGQLAPQGSGAAGSPIVISDYSTGATKPLIQGLGLVEDTILLTNQQYWEIANLRVTNKPVGATPTRGTFRGIHVYNTSGTRLNHLYIKNNEVYDIWTKSGEEAGTTLNQFKAWAGIHVRTDDSAGSSYDDVLIEGNVVHESGGTGIATTGELTTATVDYFTNVRVRQNEVYNGRADGIIIRSSLNPLIEYNFVHNNGNGGKGQGTVALWVRSTRGAVVQYNEVSYQGLTGGDGQGLDADLNAKETIFQYNYSHNNYGGMLLIYNNSATGTVARYNISIDDAVYRPFLTLNESATIYNNTFIQRGGTNTKALLKSSSWSTTIYNNIFWRQNAPTKTYDSTSDVAADFRNNSFFYAAGSHPSDEPTGNGNSTADPMFVTAPTAAVDGRGSVTGYRLKPGSPALGSGYVIASNGGKDYFGNTVGTVSVPNRGFYEGGGVTSSSITTLFPTADAYVQNGTYATQNFGTASILFVKDSTVSGYRRKTFLRFDLGSTATVTSARLRLYGNNIQDNTAVTLSAYGVDTDTWGETTVTWNLAPTRSMAALGTVVVNATQQYYEIDVTAFVRAQLGDHLASFSLEDVQSTDRSLNFRSRETGANQPQLVITP